MSRRRSPRVVDAPRRGGSGSSRPRSPSRARRAGSPCGPRAPGTKSASMPSRRSVSSRTKRAVVVEVVDRHACARTGAPRRRAPGGSGTRARPRRAPRSRARRPPRGSARRSRRVKNRSAVVVRARPGAGGRDSRSAQSSARPDLRSSGVVTLMLPAGQLARSRRGRRARSTSEASSVAAASTSSGAVSARRRRARPEHLRRLHRPQARRSSVRTHVAGGVGLLDRVGHRRRGDRGVVAAQRGDAARTRSGVTSGRAASCTTTRSPSGAAASALRTDSERVLAARARRSAPRARS